MARMLSRLVVVALSMVLLTVFLVPALAQETEKKVSIDQVPKAVKKAILKAVGDGKLVDIGEITRNGRKYYEIEMVVDGKEYDVLFDSKGKALKKTFEGLKGKKSAEKGKEEDAPGEGGEKDKPVAGEEDKAAQDKEKEEAKKKPGSYQDSFDIENRNFTTKGRNKYFILEPGYQLVLEGMDGEQKVRMEITVLDKTKKVGDINTRVVEEKETVDGELVEISRNFFAMCRETKSIFYFGEDVDMYKGGKVVSHEGAWIAGKNGAKAGMMMPGEPVLGAKFYQEIAPEIAMDRAKISAVDATLKTPAGEFKNCLRLKETNKLEPGAKEYKIHAPGVGLIQDEDLLLVKYGFVKK